jgi:hypothetical protein
VNVRNKQMNHRASHSYPCSAARTFFVRFHGFFSRIHITLNITHGNQSVRQLLVVVAQLGPTNTQTLRVTLHCKLVLLLFSVHVSNVLKCFRHFYVVLVELADAQSFPQ